MSRPALVFLAAGLLALPVSAQNTVSRSVAATTGGRLILRVEFGQIRAVSAAAETVNVEVAFRGDGPAAEYQELLRDFTLDVSENAGTVRVDGRFTGGWVSRSQSFWSFLFSGGNAWRFCRDGRCLRYTWLREVEYRVTVPRRFDVDLNTSSGSIEVDNLAGEVRVNTSGGSLHIGRIEGGVNGHTSGGSITVRGAQGRAVLRTSGGSIRLNEVAGDVDAETSGGSIEVTRASGKVRVRTSGGSINVAEPRGGIDASTSGGSIAVRVPGDRGFDIDAATSGGAVSTNFDVPRPRNQPNVLRASVNGGGPLLRLRTSGGGISIHKTR